MKKWYGYFLFMVACSCFAMDVDVEFGKNGYTTGGGFDHVSLLSSTEDIPQEVADPSSVAWDITSELFDSSTIATGNFDKSLDVRVYNKIKDQLENDPNLCQELASILANVKKDGHENPIKRLQANALKQEFRDLKWNHKRKILGCTCLVTVSALLCSAIGFLGTYGFGLVHDSISN